MPRSRPDPSAPTSFRRIAAGLLLALLLVPALPAPPAAAADAPEDDPFDEVELIPEDPPAWTPTNLLAPVTGLFLGGPGYWYDNRVVEIETTPPGAVLDLFYVRRNFQKRYEQADAPARVILPPRIEATSRDSLTVRALLDGYRQREVKIPVRSREKTLMIDLAPLPNTLLAFSHTWFAGRGSLTFRTKEALTFRLQKSSDGIGVVLTETGRSPEARAAMKGVSSPLVRSVRGQQLGEDLVVRVGLTELGRDGAFDTRSRQSVDAVRGVHVFAIDFVPNDGGAADIRRAREALARIGPEAARGCALEFDDALRRELDPAALARALTPNGSYTDRYMRAAMKRLGELSPGGVLRLVDGSEFRGDIPIELMAAATQPNLVIGYLSVLRAFVAELEPVDVRRGTLRGLVAPDLPPADFDALLDAAEAREAACAA
ncbi:MAG: hypothetical protein ACQGVC_02575 [Myxococcota bacterium]